MMRAAMPTPGNEGRDGAHAGAEPMEQRGFAALIMRLLRRFAPGHAEAAARESREWHVVCPECGATRSWASLGGIRYKAASKGKRVRLMCPACRQRRWHRVERRAPPDDQQPA